MKRKFAFLLFAIIAAAVPAFTQVFSLTDSRTIFKSREGKILSKEEVEEQINGAFSIQKENVDGKQVITIIPSANDEMAGRNAMIELFKRSLIDKPLAAFRLPGLYYQVWDSKQLRGRVLVMNFWFTACGPCIKEMPVLNELASEYRYKNTIFLAPSPDTRNQVKRFLKKNAFNYNIIPASLKYINTMQIQNFPTHLVIDKNGIIRQVFIGYDDTIKEKLKTVIDKLLKEPW